MIMRRALIAVFAAIVSVSFAQAGEGPKVAVVRIQDAINSYERAKELQKDIDASFKDQKEQINKLREELKVLQKEVQADSVLEPNDMKQFQKIQDLRAKEFTLKTLGNSFMKEYNDRMVEFYRAIYADFQAAVKEYATNNGCDLVLRKVKDDLEAPNVQGVQQEIAIKVVQFASAAVDCTDQVLAIMNRNFEKVKAARKTAPAGR